MQNFKLFYGNNFIEVEHCFNDVFKLRIGSSGGDKSSGRSENRMFSEEDLRSFFNSVTPYLGITKDINSTYTVKGDTKPCLSYKISSEEVTIGLTKGSYQSVNLTKTEYTEFVEIFNTFVSNNTNPLADPS